MSAPKDAVAEVVEALGGGDGITVHSRGGACRCGPGFCAKSRGLAFYAACKGRSKGRSKGVKPAPKCPKCSAPHQSAAGCWLCSRNTSRPIEPWEEEYNAAWLMLLYAGIGGWAVFSVQSVTGLDFPEAVEIAIGQFPRQHPVDTCDDPERPAFATADRRFGPPTSGL